MNEAARKIGRALDRERGELGAEQRDSVGERCVRARRLRDAGQSPIDLVGLVAAGAVIRERRAGQVHERERAARLARVPGGDLRARQRPPGQPREQRDDLAAPEREGHRAVEAHLRIGVGGRASERRRRRDPARRQELDDRRLVLHVIERLALVDAQEARAQRGLDADVGVDGADRDRLVAEIGRGVVAEQAQDLDDVGGAEHAKLSHGSRILPTSRRRRRAES